jgi:alpha-galactosidase
MRTSVLLAVAFSALLACVTVSALDNGLNLTPQMGWNSWNHYNCNVSAALISSQAQAMISTGLAAKGYSYINIDDCWQVSRDAKGTIVEDPVGFPKGMKALADYVHSVGLKFGLYSSAGTHTCQGRPGGLFYEVNDANWYAAVGTDYLKYDNCNNIGVTPIQRYLPMRDALNATGRPILFSMCEWGESTVWEWAAPVGNSWRTTGDIGDSWGSMITRADQNEPLASYGGPGSFNDPDMLEVGNGGMTSSEYEVHFSLWCLMKAPLIIGCDMTSMSADALRILGNTEAIAISQDPTGAQGYRIQGDENDDINIWTGALSDGWTVAIVNRGSVSHTVGFSFVHIGVPPKLGPLKVRDLWKHQDLGTFTGSFPATEVDSHGVLFLKLTIPSGENPVHTADPTELRSLGKIRTKKMRLHPELRRKQHVPAHW